MKTLVVTGHPRKNSLTAQVVDRFSGTLRETGHEVELADLHAEGFDPVLREEDEPDWNDTRKVYSPAVVGEMRRVERNEATVLIFPIYWWSFPALLKGWIDRVWNHGWAYGDATYPHRRVWLLGIAGTDQAAYAKRGYDQAMKIQLQVGILDYCGVEEGRLEILYGSIEGADYVDQILADTVRLAKAF